MSPWPNFRRVDLDQLYMGFLEPALEVIAACTKRGANYVATSGYRSFGEQLKLWSQGRTAPGDKVTNAGPGESPHNFGIALDFARIEGGKYLRRFEDYRILGEEAEARGLVWGGRFVHAPLDGPHIQLAGYVTRAQLAPLKAAYLANNAHPLSAVFEFLGKGANAHG